MQERDNSFLDPKTILAIVLVGLVWFGWQTYLTKKYPNQTQKTQQQTKEISTTNNGGNSPTSTSTDSEIVGDKSIKQENKNIEPINIANQFKEETLKIENNSLNFEISNKGMGLKNVTLNNFFDREKNPIKLGQSENNNLFEMRLNGKVIEFDLKEVPSTKANEKIIEGVSLVGAMKITRQIILNEGYELRSNILIQNPSEDFRGFEIILPEKRIISTGGSIFAPSMDIQEFLFGSSGKVERVLVSSSKENIQKEPGIFDIVGVSSHYFSTALLNFSQISPDIKLDMNIQNPEIKAEARFKPVNISNNMEFKAFMFVGPKDLSVLESFSSMLEKDVTPILNFGFFGTIGKALLKTLQFFYNSVFPNWGLAIILLTILVRILVLPFNIASYKSMKKMQVIQPMIQSLRERYKDEPQTLNAEMMKLMRENKVNPLGGCLPMLLQMPVFFALYQVLSQSIELYQAPFFGWIQDLSLKDPYFILPILMAASMWYNQKITPTTMDPTQAKVMQFLPIVFGLMMVALPSGLTLYIFVSTVFGIIQQQIFMRDKAKA